MTLTSELDDLFREHHQLIYRTAYSVTGSKPDAEDVLQEVKELTHRSQAVFHRGAGAELDEVLQFPTSPVHDLRDT